MTSNAALAETASLIGEPTRTAMLVTMMDGRAFTAGELARAAGVTAQTASGHLARLEQAGLIACARQGRHRYFRLASATVATMIESLMAVTAMLREPAAPTRTIRTGPRDAALRRARICYDHLAGELGVAIAEAMRRKGHVEIDDAQARITPSGLAFLADFGAMPPPGTRPRCRACLDWSERRPHLAGAVGAAVLDRLFALCWIVRAEAGRAVRITRAGEIGLEERFGIVLDSAGRIHLRHSLTLL